MREQLRELESEVRHLQVLPAADVRARGRRRGRRQLAVTLVAGAVVATTVGVTVTRSSDEPPVQSAAGSSEVACVVSLPSSPAAVRIQVLDGGAPAGSAAATVAGLRDRSYTVNGTTRTTTVHNPATLRYGPRAIGAAALLRAQLREDAEMVFEPARDGDTVDLTIGPGFAARLVTPTELNQALAAAGTPSAPPQCTSVTKVS
ncbi:LytR C-terminal domain-containing protein [Actinoplanes solisilvae]|uniref:LytR C-terminal domain-containing protein n=1 Tax=Actinoplanes solisilvae TaxID=2486853 RepID=UPI0013E40AFC|nr:LytR C-terminal domain-containing protein [Actinoplanes solisilvae]